MRDQPIPEPQDILPHVQVCKSSKGFWFLDATGSWVPVPTSWMSDTDLEAIVALCESELQDRFHRKKEME